MDMRMKVITTSKQQTYVRVHEPHDNGDADAVDVIDLGAPRRRRSPAAPPPPRSPLVPNPRLYPGQPPKPPPKARLRRRKRCLRWSLPNSRLYRPAPPRPPPPPARPRAAWSAPAPARPLDTASRVAFRLGERRQASPQKAPQSTEKSYRPVSEHYRARASPLRPGAGTPPPAARAMSAAEGHESPTAPSEFLAEFLSAIMRRQYAEALKYCGLILQYEPHNATARGFYPLLQHKLAARDSAHEESASSGSGASPGSGSGSRSVVDSDSESERSSLELAWEGSARTDSGASSPPPPSPPPLPAVAADNNGNPPPAPTTLHEDENDNTAAACAEPRMRLTALTAPHTQQGAVLAGSASLRRLRAQFACSIK